MIRCLAFCAPIQRRKVLNDINNIEWNDLWTRNTGWYMPPGPFTFVCYLLYARSDHTMHKFGVAVHFPCSTKSSISTQDRSLKNDSFAVRSDCCRSHGCTWWVLYNFRVWNVEWHEPGVHELQPCVQFADHFCGTPLIFKDGQSSFQFWLW